MKRQIVVFLLLVGVVLSPVTGHGEKEDPYKASIVMEVNSGKILEGENIHLQSPPASITKLMLVDIVMEKIDAGELTLSDRITVSANASKMGGSQVYLKQGEVFTLEELLRATLIASANDAAYAIGEHVAGSAEAFVALMNQKAKALGMADTVYHSVHGLPPGKGQQADISSCHDLALLAREILIKYPMVLKWTSIRSEGFREGQFILYNSNKLLARMPQVDGLKTGYFHAAGFSVVATAKKGGVRLIVVILGSPRSRLRNAAAVEKFQKYFSEYAMVHVIEKGQVINQEILLPQGKTRSLKGVAAAEFLYPVAKSQKDSLVTDVNLPSQIEGAIKEGQKLGEVHIRLDGGTVGSVDIVSPVNVPKAGLFIRVLRWFGIGS